MRERGDWSERDFEESFARGLLRQLWDPAILVGPATVLRCLNHAAEEMPARHAHGEGTPERWWESVFFGPGNEALRTWLLEVRTSGSPVHRREVIVVPPGSERRAFLVWDLSALPADPSVGGPGMVVLVRDRTQERRMQEALRRERDFSQRVLDAAGALVVVLDPQGRIVRFNRVCEEVSGYRESEVIGQSLPDLLLPPEEKTGVLAVFEDLGSGNFPNQHENDWVTRQGERRRIRWTNSVFLSDDGQVRYLVGTGFDVTEDRRREAHLRHQVLHDPLTGLANRLLLTELLHLAFHRTQRDPDHRFGLMFLDLDGFKDINDRQGHPFGDLVLQAVAERLRRGVRKTDTVVRYGGDEFVVLIEPVAGEEVLPVLAQRVLRILREPLEIGGVRLALTASIGLVLGNQGESSPEELLARADQAMYQAKRSGRSRSAFLPRIEGPRT